MCSFLFHVWAVPSTKAAPPQISASFSLNGANTLFLLSVFIDVSKMASLSLEGDNHLRHRVYYSLKSLFLWNFIVYLQREEFNSYSMPHTVSLISSLLLLSQKVRSSKMLSSGTYSSMDGLGKIKTISLFLRWSATALFYNQT